MSSANYKIFITITSRTIHTCNQVIAQTSNMRAIKTHNQAINQANKQSIIQAINQSILIAILLVIDPSTHDLQLNVDESMRGYTLKNEAKLFI